MFSKAKLLLLHAVSSVHAGSGSELGLVDLPVQREKHTGYPKIESSSLKGAIRATVVECLENESRQELINIVFGRESEKNQNNAQAGAISFADARLLLFPVKSLRGVFAWITCRQVINRFNNEVGYYNMTGISSLPVPTENTVSSDKLVVNPSADRKQVTLEEYTYDVTVDGDCQILARQLADWLFPGLNNGFAERLMVVADDDFVDFVTLSTEVNARIRVDVKTGTVQEGALWYEENVPPEAVFYSVCFIGKSRSVEAVKMKDVSDIEKFIIDDKHFPPVFQLGGNSTLGRGLLRRIWL